MDRMVVTVVATVRRSIDAVAQEVMRFQTATGTASSMIQSSPDATRYPAE